MVPEEKIEKDDIEDLLKVLELLEKKSNENEKELDAHERMLNIMVGGQGEIIFLEEEDGEKEELRGRAKKTGMRLERTFLLIIKKVNK